MNDIPQTERAVQLVGPDKLELNSAKPVADPGPHQVLARGRGGRPVLLRPQAAQAVLPAQPEVRRPDRPRRAGAGGNAELRAGRRADRPRPRSGRPRRQGRAGRRPLQDRRAVHRRDRLPLAADRQVQRRLRLQFRGRVAGICAARRAGHHLARGRIDADPGARGSVGLGARAGRAVGLRRERLHRGPAADAEARRPPARGRRRARRPRRRRQVPRSAGVGRLRDRRFPSPRNRTRASTTSSISAPTPRRRRRCLPSSPRAACWRSSRAAGKFGRPVETQVGRVHYGGIRVVGTAGADPAAAYAAIPASPEIRAGRQDQHRRRGGTDGDDARHPRPVSGRRGRDRLRRRSQRRASRRARRARFAAGGEERRHAAPLQSVQESAGRRLRLRRADGARPRSGRRRPSRRRRETPSSMSSPASRPTRRPPSTSTPMSRSSSISSAPAARS